MTYVAACRCGVTITDVHNLDSYRMDRPHPIDEEPWRSPFERDADRILYASAFSRLRDVTQVLRPGSLHPSHDRLLHSLKVAQVGYRLAQYLRHSAQSERISLPHEIDPDVVYSAGLAHDLGHPPFGHIGEKAIQDAVDGIIEDRLSPDGALRLDDSFEGNAQSFRIVTRLSFRSGSHGQRSGLNLTWATLAAILKYPWLKREAQAKSWTGEKWGSYDADKFYLDGAQSAIPSGWRRSIEASIMDWADDITYAVHDVEDFIRAGLIPIHELSRSNDEQVDFRSYCEPRLQDHGLDVSGREVLRALKNILSSGLRRSYRGSRLDKQVMHAWASGRINFFSYSAKIGSDGLLTISDPVMLENVLMKQLVWFYVVDHPTLCSEHQGQRRLVMKLLEALYEWSRGLLVNGSGRALPHQTSIRRYPSRLVDFAGLSLDEQGEHTDIYPNDRVRLFRAVVDYLASLSDDEAVMLYQRLVSTSQGNTRFLRA